MPKVSSTSNNGFILVEVILTSALFAVVATGLFSAFYYGLQSVRYAGQRDRAVLLTEEGLEASRSIRDRGYTNLVDGSYGITNDGTKWSFVPGSDANGIYTRQITVQTIDSHTKYVLSTVLWKQPLKTQSAFALVTYLTDWTEIPVWTNPQSGTCLNISGGQDAQKIAVSGNYAFLVTNSAGYSLVSIDVSNVANIHQADAVGIQNNPTNIAISGTKAYVTTRNNSAELQVVDITDPTTFGIPVSVDLSGNSDANAVAISGSNAFVTRDAGFEEFHTVNANPPYQQRSLQELTYSAREVYMHGNYAYVASADNSQELKIVNVTNPASTSLAGGYDDPSSIADGVVVTGYGNYVFLGRSDGKVLIFDITNATSPQRIGTYDAVQGVNDLAVDSTHNLLFAVTNVGSKELQIIDLTTPASPIQRGYYDADDTLNGVAYDATRNLVYIVGVSNHNNFCSIKPS
jgi:hypothetical protein